MLIAVVCWQCKNAPKDATDTVFTQIPAQQSGLSFTNTLTLKPGFDVFRYRNFYNGGGVAIGDIDNDGLADIFLTANMGPNKLFRNKGNWQFEDITAQAGVAGSKPWSTGVAMADVNGDGLLDLYVCNSGGIDGGDKANELFINQGNGIFEEQAAAFGLADEGFSTHAVFLDYDLDGDLDCYILNNSFRPVSSLGLENIRHIRDPLGGDKLMRNDQGKFTDVSEEAGIHGSVIGFGLGITVDDFNLDGWPDIYVSNDFFERDYLYLNAQDGTFTEELTEAMTHTSLFSMGADVGDLNNDGLPELFVTDMLPADNHRLKRVTKHDSYDFNQRKIKNGFHHQHMHNTLQLNNGDGTFSEIGRLAGMEATDWSWGALIADFDNDGYKEVFVANGVYKDVTDQDFIDYLASDKNIIEAIQKNAVDFEKFVNLMPSTKLPNYLFKQQKGMQYTNVAAEWGVATPSFSNGAAYGDLDNDGDLDLIVNNVNQPLFVYRNNTESDTTHHFLRINLKGTEKNTFAVGAKVTAYTQSGQRTFSHMPMRGFQSSMGYSMLVGLGQDALVDSLIVQWQPGLTSKLYQITANQTLTLEQQKAKKSPSKTPSPAVASWLTELPSSQVPGFTHQENNFVDFDRERLIYHMLSREGPALAVGDLNGDGLDDVFVGGAVEQAGAMYLQQPDGSFQHINKTLFDQRIMSEDTDAAFFDADGDGDLDLYVTSGGAVYPQGSSRLSDGLYLQTGLSGKTPVFIQSNGQIPNIREASSCVTPGDFDNDGDIDLFVGSRQKPGQYGMPVTSYILENNGKGVFSNVTRDIAPRLGNIGMVSDACWVDLDNDNDLDLAIAAEWMPIIVFKNNGTTLERLNNTPGLTGSNGWWNTIMPIDINQDGHMDLIAGNWGLNSKFRASAQKPITLLVNDFDKNQSIDHVYATYEDTTLYPLALKHEITMQLNSLKKQFVYYKDYADKTIEDIFDQEQITQSIRLEAYQMASSVIINNGDGSYTLKPLPEAAQYAPIFGLMAADLNGDGLKEVLLGGNFDGTKPEEGRYDASYGLALTFDKDGTMRVVQPKTSGFFIKGNVKAIRLLNGPKGSKSVLVARNNQTLAAFRVQHTVKSQHQPTTFN